MLSLSFTFTTNIATMPLLVRALITAFPFETAVIVVPDTDTIFVSDDVYVNPFAVWNSSSSTIRLKPLSFLMFPPFAVIS